jgi:hypothetical protein
MEVYRWENHLYLGDFPACAMELMTLESIVGLLIDGI